MTALVVVTDGRSVDGHPLVEAAVASALSAVRGEITTRIVSDDSGDVERHRWLRENLGPLGFHVLTSPARRGYCAHMADLWPFVGALDEDDVFWLEDDFRFRSTVELGTMKAILAARPEVRQVVLKRNPWWGNEVEAGGIIEANPTAYTDVSDGILQWVEHREHWSMNPTLFPTDLVRSTPWPSPPWCEARFGKGILDADPDARFALLGRRSDPPLVCHVGIREGSGY